MAFIDHKKDMAVRQMRLGMVIAGVMDKVNKRGLHRDGLDPDKGEPIKADKWRNIFFLKSGKTVLGYNIHDSEEIAKKCMEEFVAENEADISSGKYDEIEITCPDTGVVQYLWSDYSHALALPWRE